MDLKCFLCNESVTGFLRGLKGHFVQRHNLIFNNSNCYYDFVCGQNCYSKFSSFKTLSRHILAKHKQDSTSEDSRLDLNNEFLANFINNFQQPDCVNTSDPNVIDVIDNTFDNSFDNFQQPDLINATSGSNVSLDDVETKLITLTDLEYSINNIICEIRTHTNLAETTLEYVVGSIRDISDNLIRYLRNQIEEREDEENMLDIINNLDLVALFKNTSTFSNQKKFIAKKIPVVDSEEIKLGTRVETTMKNGIHSIKTIKESFEYIPITRTLESIIRNQNLRFQIDNEPNNTNSESITSFRDTNTYKNSTFFQSHPNAIRINLYYDDIEICNPIGSRSSFHKLAMLYFTIQNFPLQMNSALNNIYILAICYKSDIKKYGFDAILKPFVDDLKMLESEAGFPIYIDESTIYTIRASLVSFTGDTLAAHEILGHMGPSCKYFCRICYISRLELHIDAPGTKYGFRNRDDHQIQVKRVLERPSSSKFFGINGDTELNKLTNFNSTENIIFDPMHYLLEGIVPLEIKIVLNYYIFEKNYFSIDFLNQRIHAFRYGCIEIKNKPSANFTDEIIKSNSNKIKQKSVQTWLLLRALPFLIGHKIPDEDLKHFELLIKLMKIVEISFSPQLNEFIICKLEEHIYYHHMMFKQLFPNKNMINKHHHLTHYPQTIRTKGPTLLYSCLRFESKHYLFKKQIYVSQNYINLPKSLAKRQSLNQSFNIYNTLFNKKSIEIISGRNSLIVHSAAKDLILEIYPNLEHVYLINSVKLNNVEYRKQFVIIQDSNYSVFPNFIIIEEIFKAEEKIYLLVKKLVKKDFVEKLNAFEVDDENGERFLFLLSDVSDYRPNILWEIHNSSTKYLATKFVI